MLPKESTIYAVCIPGKTVRYEAKSKIIPIMGNSCALTKQQRENLREKGYVFDDRGSQFSKLNPYWGELTCIDWIVNNATANNIGNAQYRRFWVEPSEKDWYQDDTLYFPHAGYFSCSLEQQFYGGHKKFDAPKITREMAATGNWTFTPNEIEKLWKQNSFIGCNMARGPIELYKQFAKLLFDCLMPIWEIHKEHFLTIEGYDKRALAYIAERLITGLVLKREKFFPGVKIATAPISFIR